MKKLFFIIISIVLWGVPSVAQDKKKIIIENADFIDRNQTEIPGAVVLTGNVRILHDGVKMSCNKAYQFESENYIKGFGNVVMNQGDTIFMNSKYAEYNGDKKFAFASGDVSMRSPEMRLTTDTVYFDRNIQEAYYNSYGTIVNDKNTLKSKSGRYFMTQKKYQFTTAVTLTNPEYVMKSNHLDYFTNSGHSYVFGPTTITGKTSFIYTEKGFYDTKKNVAHLLTKSYIKYDTQLIKGDSIYYDRKREFSSATNNVSVTDTVNKFDIKGHYGEVYKLKDSLFITKHAVATTLVEQDSLYTHAKRMVVTGKPGFRIMRGYNDARFYKTDMSGKCDSIHSNEAIGLTQLIKRPVVWNGESQVTGDVIHLISNSKTEQLDSIKVLNNAFIVQKDTIWSKVHPDKPRYSQIKGVNLYGKFRDNKLYEIDLIKNTEKLYYMYNDGGTELIGIDKGISSKIHIELENNQIVVVQSLVMPKSTSYPDADLDENARKLKNFVWRGDERILTKDDIFPQEEKDLHEAILKKTRATAKVVDKPMEVMQETLDYDKDHPKPKPKPEAAPPAAAKSGQ
ncbi:OstA-like protein [Flavobacterium subsaxonicum]|uniref:OstA-like protein n=1 Tax=Flavobacterium subsaxonicum WB 4.1-42 = DSM 21790 TaxID=1121898 RepID=A0A0A2MXQ9_9FLAO|nr:OstA-like protein [Flavobacterium subsaxonicum]KGO93010.1 OstA-like protein [Flavobacterium subsaxonicum WB 4.1-42 = DSM 21790]